MNQEMFFKIRREIIDLTKEKDKRYVIELTARMLTEQRTTIHILRAKIKDMELAG